jgi:hypothetical protein
MAACTADGVLLQMIYCTQQQMRDSNGMSNVCMAVCYFTKLHYISPNKLCIYHERGHMHVQTC